MKLDDLTLIIISGSNGHSTFNIQLNNHSGQWRVGVKTKGRIIDTCIAKVYITHNIIPKIRTYSTCVPKANPDFFRHFEQLGIFQQTGEPWQ